MSNDRRARGFGRGLASVLGFILLIGCQESGSPDTQVVIDEARHLIDDGQFAEGLEKMRMLVEANPDDAHIQTLYGEALIATGQPSLAVWPLSRAIRDPEQLVHAGLLLTQAQTQAGSGIDAIKTATRVLEADPKNEAALLLRVDAFLGENLEERALEDLDRAEELGSDKAKLDLLRLDALLGLGREQEAEALLAELTEQAANLREEDPASAARLCAATATFTFERGDIEGAKKRFDDCLESNGTQHGVLFQAAVRFFDEHGQSDRATEIYKLRFEEYPERLDARVDYADRLQKVGRMKDGEALLLEVTDKQKAVWTALADLYAIAGDIPKALEALDQAIAASPTQREDWLFTRADFLLALGEVDQAEKALEKIDVPAHQALLRARIAAARGDLDAAIENFEEGIRLWPDNPDARYLAGRVYERKGEWKKASAHYREAARMEKPHYLSSLALADLQRALGDMEGVQFLLMRLSESHPNDPKVLEYMIQYASDTGAGEFGMRVLNHLSRIKGQAAHAVALATARVEQTEGPEAALVAIDQTGLDVFDPANVEALESRVHLLVGLDREQDALAAVEKALVKSPESARLLVLRASVHQAIGQPERARADLTKARSLDGQYLPALLDLASLNQATGHPDAARKLYEEAIPIESAAAEPDVPGESKAAIALARLEIEADELDAARARLRDVLDENPRQGQAAWLLLQSYADAEGGGLASEERTDLALRASVFERSPAAVDYWKKLNAGKS